MSSTPTHPIIQVEAAPMLQKQRHKEFIVCYQVDPAAKKAAVHKPKVELRRGTIVSVDKSAAVEVGPQIYLPVEKCESAPGAVGFYIRQEEVIEIPAGSGSKAVQSPGKLNLRTIKRANKAGKPIMDIAGVKLVAGHSLPDFECAPGHQLRPWQRGDRCRRSGRLLPGIRMH